MVVAEKIIVDFKSVSPEQTKGMGKLFSAALNPGDNVLLFGDLGTGKTSFVQGMAEGLGIKEPVKSPTYTYLREYEVPLKKGIHFSHYDLYRLPDNPTQAELDSIEVSDRLKSDKHITVFEWAEKIKTDNANRFVRFSAEDDGRRIVIGRYQ